MIEKEPLNADDEKAEYDATHRAIEKLYDLADQLMMTLEDARAMHQDAQIDIIEPLVEEVVSAADQLSEQFCEYADSKDKKEAAGKFGFRPVFVRIFKAVDECLNKVNQTSAEVAENITTVIMPTVDGLLKHTEKLFGRLIHIVERTRDAVKKREEFYKMVVRESHIAQLFKKKSGQGPNKNG